MYRSTRWMLVPAVLLATAACGGASAPATAAAPAASASALGVNNVAGSLASQLGISSSQASGGLGSMLGLAQSKLPAADFEKLTKAMPNSSGYMQAARDAGVTEPISDVGGFNKALGKLGLSPEQASKFGPAAADAVGKVGGPSAKNMLMGLLK